MLTSLNRMTGLPVVWRDRHMGYVERAVASVQRMQLDGLVVRRGFAGARWVPRDTVLLVGRHSVVISTRPAHMPELGQIMPGRAVLTSGFCVGEVSDVIICGDTLRVAALEVSQGPLYRLLGSCAYASACRLSEHGEVVVPPLVSWTQLLRQLGEGERE